MHLTKKRSLFGALIAASMSVVGFTAALGQSNPPKNPAGVQPGSDLSAGTSLTTGSYVSRPMSNRFLKPYNIVDYGAIGDGASHPIQGITSFAGDNTTGWTLAQWQGIFSFATALTNEIGSLAYQAALNAAHTGSSGGQVYIPGGRYQQNMVTTAPTVTNTNSNPPLPEIEVVGDGMLESVLFWQTDMGSGKFAFAAADRSISSYSRCRVRDVAIVGPGCGSTYGASATSMGGVAATMNWTFDRCWISGFYYGVALRQDHQKFIDCQISNNYYNVYFQGPPSGTDNAGNQYFRGCALGGCLYASIAVAYNSTIANAVFDTTEVGFGPYGFYRESGAATQPFLVNCSFLNSFSESCGNGVFYGENATDDITLCTFSNWNNDITNSGYNIASKPLKAGIYCGNLTFCVFTNGNLAGNIYSLAVKAIIQAQTSIQKNSFGGANALVNGHTPAKPSLLSPVILYSTFDTGECTGQFYTAQAAIAAGACVCEGGFDQAVAWTSGGVFAGIAAAPGASGGSIPVALDGVISATKSPALVIAQGQRIIPVSGGVSNVGAASAAVGFAWLTAGSGAPAVPLRLSSRADVA